jgi:hypothetical protein
MKTFVLTIAATAFLLNSTVVSAQSYNSAEYQQRVAEFQQYQREYQQHQQQVMSEPQESFVQDEQPKKKNKGLLKAVVTLALVAGLVVAAHETGVLRKNPCTVQVNGYYRSNGTYVRGHTRTCANNTVTDNYSYRR